MREARMMIYDPKIGTLQRVWGELTERLTKVSVWVSEWFNQEKWVFTITLTLSLVLNIFLSILLLTGRDNLAIAFVVLVIVIPLAILRAEIAVALLIIAGTGQVVNTLYYALESGTGFRTLSLTLLSVTSARALFEYVRIPKSQRPRLFTGLTVALLLFWVYYMAHVAYIYLFRYDEQPLTNPLVPLGMYRPGIFRYFDTVILWVGIIPTIILLRDVKRAITVAYIVFVVVMASLIALAIDYFVGLPTFWKVLFQIQAAFRTTEGYRVREPSAIFLSLVGFFASIYMLGFVRGWRTQIIIAYIIFGLFTIFVTKLRVLWAAVLVVLPFVLLLKPPQALLRMLGNGLVFALLGSVLMLSPKFFESVSQIVDEAVMRWNRTFSYGGDYTMDPSYQGRLREKEAWEFRMKRLNTFNRLFGAGLEEGYGRYISLNETEMFAQNPRFRQVYVERGSMHFPWLLRQLRLGLVGTALLAVTLLMVFLRGIYAIVVIRNVVVRAVLMGILGATFCAIAVDSIQSEALIRDESFGTIILWSVIEAALHWKRTGQIDVIQNH